MRAGRRAAGKEWRSLWGKLRLDNWMELCCSALLHGVCWGLGRGPLRSLRFVLGGKLLFHFGCDGVYIHLVELGGFLEELAGVVHSACRVENDDLHQQASENAFLGLADEGRKQLGRCVGRGFRLADAVLT